MANAVIARNYVALVLGEAVTRLGGFLLFLFIAVYLDAQSLGEFSFAIAATAYLQLLTEFGLSSLGAKEIAKDKTQTSRIGSEVFYLQLLFAVFSLIILFVVLQILHLDPTLELVTLLFGLTVIPTALNVSYLFQAHQKMHYIAITRTLGQLVYLLVGLALVYYSRTVVVLPAVQFFANLAIAVAAFMFAWKKLGFRLVGVSRAGLKSIIIRSLPFALSAVMVQIFYNSDSIFLEFMKGTEAVGNYQAGYRLVMFIILLFGFSGMALFPHFSEMTNTKTFGQMSGTFKRIITLLSLSIFPIALLWVIQGDDVLRFVYRGDDYLVATASFAVLSLGMIVVIYNQLIGSALLAMDGQKAALKAVTIAAVGNIAFNFILIPRFGLLGAAMSTVIAELLNMAYMQYHTRQYFGYELLRHYLGSPLIPASLLVIVSVVFKHVFGLPWLGMVLAGTVYVVTIFALKIVTINQVADTVRQVMHRGVPQESI